MEDCSDEELVRASLLHSGRAFHPYECLVKRYEPLVNKLCLRYFRNSEIAEEITQESFLKAYNYLKKLEDPAQFKSWVLRIASNLCTDRYRKIKRRKEIQEQVEKELDIETGQEAAVPEKAELLMEALEQLNEKDREIILMHYFSDLSIREIAVELSLGESAVKMRLSRVRDKLSQWMEKKM